MTLITRVEIHEFEFDAINFGHQSGAKTVGAVGYVKGEVTRLPKFAVRIEIEDGCRGEYVTHRVASAATFAQTKMLAPRLIGRHAEEREGFYNDLKWEVRQFDHMGHGWRDGDAREEAANVLHVAKTVGDRMTLMLDPACTLHTFADALYVGRACDEGGFFWF